MLKNKFKVIRKILVIAIASGVGVMVTGCNNGQQKYIEAGLSQLEEKYGEEFEFNGIVEGFGVTNDVFKMICSPKNDKNKTFEVGVKKDSTLFWDSYIGRLMDEKLENILYEPASELFGKDVIIKSKISGYFTKYSSLDMDVIDYLNENNNINFSLTVFVKADKKVDKDKESKLIYEYVSRILDMGIDNGKAVNFFYVNEDCYNNIENTYYDKYNNEGVREMIRYYKLDENSYSLAYCSDVDGEHNYTIEDIRTSFDKLK